MKTRKYIAPEYATQLGTLIDTIATTGVPTDAECIYEGRNRVYKLRFNDLTLSIKAFKIPRFPNSFVYGNLRKSKARRSFEFADALLLRGIDTPAPIAWIEKTSGGKMLESYYICLHSPYPNNLRNWEERPADEQEKLLTAYARLLAHLHRAGIHNHDLSPGNVLWDYDNDGNIVFQIIDLNRTTMHKRPLTRSEAFSNFRNINIIHPEQTRRLAQKYGAEIGMDPDVAGCLAINAMNKDLRAKNRRHKLKRLLKPKSTKRSTWNINN